MKVLVTGASGFIGAAIAARFAARGDHVLRLTRSASHQGMPGDPPAPETRATRPTDASAYWDPSLGRLDPDPLEGIDAAIHLAGESLAGGRWTAARKERIRTSRLEGTALLARTLAGLERPPRVLVSASAVGYYGDRGEELLDEESPPGSGFLADVCRGWEAAAEQAAAGGIRVVTLRSGVVLGPGGGALASMLPLFRMGLGGALGSGRQWMSWIALDDLSRAVEHSIARHDLRGAVNAVAPNPVTNREFTRTLARALRRPALMPVPAPALKIALGELAGAVLSSQRVRPRRLLESGFRFECPNLADALRRALERAP